MNIPRVVSLRSPSADFPRLTASGLYLRLLLYRENGVLTRKIITTGPSFVHALRVQVVSAGDFAYGFVACGKQDDSEERENEGGGARDMPAFEDNAKVLRAPSEQHLWLIC